MRRRGKLSAVERMRIKSVVEEVTRLDKLRSEHGTGHAPGTEPECELCAVHQEPPDDAA